jgi:hypothetical protein
MVNVNDLRDLDADLEGKKVEVVRERTNVLISTKLKEQLKITYPNRSLGSILEEGAMVKLRKDGHLPEKPKGVEPAGMDAYAEAKKEKVAIDEIKERVEKSSAKKPA